MSPERLTRRAFCKKSLETIFGAALFSLFPSIPFKPQKSEASELLDAESVFRQFFEDYGGIKTFGYPLSKPYQSSEGAKFQLFQRALLQLDKTDNCFLVSLPKQITELKGENERLSWLTCEPIARAYFANPNPAKISVWQPEEFYGLPLSQPQDFGSFIIQSFDNYVFQYWKEEEPTDLAGQVVGVLIGQVAIEAGLIPKESLVEPLNYFEGWLQKNSQESASSEKEIINQPEEKESVRYPIYWGNRLKPEVALTFDDGFQRESIERSLEVLRKNNLKCTFFIIGQLLPCHADLWQQAVRDDHQICNHTYSHAYLTSLSSEGIREEIRNWEQAAKEVLGEDYYRQMKANFPFIRFPGGDGHKNIKVLKTVTEMGYLPIAWSADTYYAVLKNHDYRNEPAGPIAKEVCQHITSSSQNGSIVLLHFNIWDVSELEGMIAGIKEKKLGIKTVTEVLD